MNTELKKKLTATDKWFRLLFVVIYLVVNYVAQFIIWALAAIQFIFALLTGSPNQNLLSFTRGLNAFCYDILQYVTYNTQDKPFPFGSWPKGQ
jgi:hypothetical protein